MPSDNNGQTLSERQPHSFQNCPAGHRFSQPVAFRQLMSVSRSRGQVASADAKMSHTDSSSARDSQMKVKCSKSICSAHKVKTGTLTNILMHRSRALRPIKAGVFVWHWSLVDHMSTNLDATLIGRASSRDNLKSSEESSLKIPHSPVVLLSHFRSATMVVYSAVETILNPRIDSSNKLETPSLCKVSSVFEKGSDTSSLLT